MIISRSEINHVLCAYSRQAAKVSTPCAAAAGAAGSKRADAVDLSARAREIGRLRDAIASLPDVRPDRMAPVARAVAAGTYHVSDDEIAEKMLGRSIVDGLA